MRSKNTVRLNKHDLLMLALEDVITAQTQLLAFRFKEKHSAEEMRQAMRYMLTIYPKLRSVVEPTLFSYRIRIFDDNDRQLEVLFNDAFRVVPNVVYASEEFVTFRRNLLNEPFSLEQGLPLKMRYFPDDPQPVLFVSMHHMITDGLGWFHMEHSLLKYLNGEKPPLVPLDSPNMLPALIKKPYSTLPRQIYNSYKIYRKALQETKGEVIVTPSSRPVDFWGPVGMLQRFVSLDLKSLKKVSKALGYSINTMHLAALTMASIRGPGRDTGNTVCIVMSVDLRPFFEDKPPVFGNYTGIFTVRVPKRCWDDPKEIMRVIQEQMGKGMDSFKNKEIIFPWLIDKLFTVIGKKFYAWGARWVRKKGLVSMTFAFSTFSNIDIINSHGTKAQVSETMSLVPQYGLFVTSASLEGRTYIDISYPEAEYTHEEIEAFYNRYEQALGEILAL